MQIAFAIIGFECLSAAKCYMCTHKPIFSGPQTIWKWVSHWCCVGNESLAAQQPCKPCLFHSGSLVWFPSLSGLLVRRRGGSWIAMVGRHPARQKPRWRLAVWAQLALKHLGTFISMPLAPGLLVSLIGAQAGAHQYRRTCVFNFQDTPAFSVLKPHWNEWEPAQRIMDLQIWRSYSQSWLKLGLARLCNARNNTDESQTEENRRCVRASLNRIFITYPFSVILLSGAVSTDYCQMVF